MAGTEPRDERQRGDGGTSDDDRQPDDTGATGTLGDVAAECLAADVPGSHHERHRRPVARRVKRRIPGETLP